jgi:radical SAM superfamily enzyme YgiQ (UPF0313 family)
MRIAVISTYTHPTRLPIKERSIMQSAVPELIAGLCPDHAEVELYNEKETFVDLNGNWDLVFFSYLHSFYEHTKVLSTTLRRRGVTTVAGGRHARHFFQDAAKYFDAVVIGDPESNVPELIRDLEQRRLKKFYNNPPVPGEEIKPYRYNLIDFKSKPTRLPPVEASRGCPFACNFCVLTGHEKYRHRPVKHVIDDINLKLHWNRNFFRLFQDAFIFLDNNLGGSPQYLKELCEALVPLKKFWGCSLTFNILQDNELVHLMAKAGCRYIYTGIESLNSDSIKSMNKSQNKLSELKKAIERCFGQGILLSFGIVVGADGDTNEYLVKLPEYLAELRCFAITYLGIVCPYPETPFFRQLVAEDRLLPNVGIRDMDGYTVCHKPAHLSSDELVDHYKRLCKSMGGLPNIIKHYWDKWSMSDARYYTRGLILSGREIVSMTHAIANPNRTFIAGEPIEGWDAERMPQLGLLPQKITDDQGQILIRQ